MHASKRAQIHAQPLGLRREPGRRVPSWVLALVAATFLLLPRVGTAPAGAQELDSPGDSAPPRAAASAERPAPASRSGAHGPSAAASRPLPAVTRPADLADVARWVAYKKNSGIAALHDEARIFYRRGLLARRAGRSAEAIRLVRGAAELDPTFVDPHETLISWFLFHEPGQALVHCAALLELLRTNFLFQLGLAANAFVSLVQVLFLALLAAGLIMVATRQHELRHGLQERLAPLLTPRAARHWPWVFLALPYVVGLGLALPTVFFLGLLWPLLKLRERVLFVLLTLFLGAAPWTVAGVSRLAAPLGDDAPPFYGTLRLESHAPSATQRQALAALAAQNSDQPFLQFGLAWAERQAGNNVAAEAAYRRVLEIWPNDDRALDNLGNVLATEGHDEQALELYQKAIAANPGNAAAYFNLAQAHTQRFDFHAANDALARASALDFELVSSHQAQTSENRPMPLVDQWIGPGRFWTALLRGPGPAIGVPQLPPAWRRHVEFSGWPFSLLALVCAILGLVLGILQQRSLPLRRCSNCDRVVCRRCAERRREVALCRSCAAVEARAKAPEFARVLLLEHRRKQLRLGRLLRTIFAILVPGFGLLALRRVTAPLLLLIATAALACAQLHVAAPFSYQARLDLPDQSWSLVLVLLPWAVVYGLSIAGYFSEQARQDAKAAVTPSRPARRSGPTLRHVPAEAA